MRSFRCHHCSQLVFFESSRCLNCGWELGFDADLLELLTLPDDATRPYCANRELSRCNWLASEEGELCVACALTRTRPSDDDVRGLEAFADAESAKRHLLFELLDIGLPVVDGQRSPEGEGGLIFDLLSSEQEPVTTGHLAGVITLDLAESDDVHRERLRRELDEPYRTVLGHFRHEVGHYYFPILAGEGTTLERARELFGDERADYQEALDRHYEQGGSRRENWEDEHVSSYAAMHPSEDWAETFAHYLHIRDSLQTAAAHRVWVLGASGGPEHRSEPVGDRPEQAADFGELVDEWLPLTYALNAINRSMGKDDLYPFVLSPRAIEKLAFVHELIRREAL